jgi:uncharacterized protein with FMN-binding domain
LLLAAGGVIAAATIGEAEMRTWSDHTGRHKIQAEFVGGQGGKVRLRNAEGRLFDVDLKALSPADQQYVRERTGGSAPTGGAPIAAGSEVEVEMLSGARVRGTLVARNAQTLSVRVMIGGRAYERKYPTSHVHALSAGGQREVLNDKSGGNPGHDPSPGGNPATGVRRSRAEIEALIDREGRTPPEWFDATPLNYPKTLDLNWPMPPPQKGWNEERNVGQYVWGRINPNPGKWREGVRLMHHLLSLHQDNPSVRVRVMNELGRMYFNLHQDYARAAFWWRQAGVDRGDQYLLSGVHLAECYWKLGNKQMAMQLLAKLPPQFNMIKLLADMGEIDQALRLADANTRGPAADVAYVYAGEACRVAGKYRQAIAYYEKLIALPAAGQRKERIERNQQLGRDAVEAIRLFELLDLGRVPDGTYHASSPGYVEDVHVDVVVSGGRITAVRVTKHKEKQFFSALTDTPQKIIAKQDVKGVDATSGATITSKAIINATAKALTGAMK